MPEFVMCPNGDLSALRSELAGVLEDIPKHLSDPRAVDKDVGLVGVQIHRYTDAFLGGRTSAIIIEGVFEQNPDVDNLSVQIEFASGDSVNVQQIINQSGLDLDVATNHL